MQRFEQPNQSAEPRNSAGAQLPDFEPIAAAILSERRVPGATYRLQFHPGFTFRDARALVEYLHDLGITDCYASPVLRARPGSTHGYDVCDHGQLNPELGDEREFDALAGALRQRGMGLIMISHNLTMVSSFCDRVLIMYAGRIVEEIAARDLQNARHPYTRALVAATPSLSERRAELATVIRDPEWLK